MNPEPLEVKDYIAQINASLLSHRARVHGEVFEVQLYPGRSYLFFKLKDKGGEAVLTCMMWKRDYERCGVELEEGSEIIANGVPEVYAPYGRFSFKPNVIELVGEGALRAAYEKLKKQLAAEGLFAPERKRALPEFPVNIGVITSKSGAVINDLTSNLGRHGFKIYFVDSRVEGQDAIHDLIAAVRTLAKKDLDVLTIMRGGGSLEALQAFNNETLVREIAKFQCPVITGIGHDKDETLVQLVADTGLSTTTAVANELNRTWEAGLRLVERNQSSVLRTFERVLSSNKDMASGYAVSVHNAFMQIQAHIQSLRQAVSHAIRDSKRMLAKHNSELTNSWSEISTSLNRAQ